MLVLIVFEFFLRIKSMGLYYPLHRDFGLQYGPLFHLNALAFEIFVKWDNVFILYFIVT